ncbi:uncharacterized protein LOC131707015 isoform X2 [Acipenser ruthenus]|uniref:uncharacterized protein LOC131707015 isoform X2 n=1 Tax=Acipenser ruthenus TaxID=7906 RepID=UPI0027425F27|nr:uncharacterized protein LOC131707015 isoform X2 [Acipenser ruthenus]
MNQPGRKPDTDRKQVLKVFHEHFRTSSCEDERIPHDSAPAPAPLPLPAPLPAPAPLPGTSLSQHRDCRKTQTGHSVHKVKRRKTRKERSQGKAGRSVIDKHLTNSRKCRQRSRRASDAPAKESIISKLSHKPEPSVITQSRLTQLSCHLGLFNREVKSVDIERLLSEQKKSRRTELETEDRDQQRTGAPALQQPSPPEIRADPHPDPEAPDSSPWESAQGAGTQTRLEAADAEGEEEEEEESSDPQGSSSTRAAPVGELASALVRLLNPRSLQSGRSLLGETRQLLHDFLAERHGKLPDISQLAVRRKLDYEMMSAPAAERGGSNRSAELCAGLRDDCSARLHPGQTSTRKRRRRRKQHFPRKMNPTLEFPGLEDLVLVEQDNPDPQQIRQSRPEQESGPVRSQRTELLDKQLRSRDKKPRGDRFFSGGLDQKLSPGLPESLFLKSEEPRQEWIDAGVRRGAFDEGLPWKDYSELGLGPTRSPFWKSAHLLPSDPRTLPQSSFLDGSPPAYRSFQNPRVASSSLARIRDAYRDSPDGGVMSTGRVGEGRRVSPSPGVPESLPWAGTGLGHEPSCFMEVRDTWGQPESLARNCFSAAGSYPSSRLQLNQWAQALYTALPEIGSRSPRQSSVYEDGEVPLSYSDGREGRCHQTGHLKSADPYGSQREERPSYFRDPSAGVGCSYREAVSNVFEGGSRRGPQGYYGQPHSLPMSYFPPSEAVDAASPVPGSYSLLPSRLEKHPSPEAWRFPRMKLY